MPASGPGWRFNQSLVQEVKLDIFFCTQGAVLFSAVSYVERGGSLPALQGFHVGVAVFFVYFYNL